MFRPFKDHLILGGSTVKQALSMLNELSQDAILFVVDENVNLMGSLTDGDIRRGLLNNFNIESKNCHEIDSLKKNLLELISSIL